MIRRALRNCGVGVAIAALGCLLGAPSHAEAWHAKAKDRRPTVSGRPISKTFQVPASLRPAVDFWRDIYATYDRGRIVLHDTEHLDIVYEVLDVADINARSDLTLNEQESLRMERLRSLKTEIRAALAALAERCPARPCAGQTAMERRVLERLGDRYSAAFARAAAGETRIRGQTGQKDKFVTGIAVSGRYLPLMERVFKEHGIPWEITRLVFVESMFNLQALSKVGASGVWQFMPGTARLHGLVRDAVIDERNDPVAATHGAARLLTTDYAELGTWPLAINAYNSGRGRLRQAVQRLGTTDIARIIRDFDHPGYGFASRNFYPEFLAALEVYEHYPVYFGALEREPPLAFEAVVVPQAVAFPDLARATDTPLALLQTLNPGYHGAVFAGEIPIPAGYTVKIPAGQGMHFLRAIGMLKKEMPVGAAAIGGVIRR